MPRKFRVVLQIAGWHLYRFDSSSEPILEITAITEVRKSAEYLFASGLFCEESVVLAIAKAEGLYSELVPKIATAFCSDMARTCGPCGALTGAIIHCYGFHSTFLHGDSARYSRLRARVR